MRQLLADKVSGNLLGLWRLVPEPLRLGTWELLRTWSAESAQEALARRLALHLVHEAALCRPSLRSDRSLRHRGFERVNGLPWLPTDGPLHDLLEAHTVEQAHQLQIHLGQLRRASGQFPGPVLALDPHRLVSHSQRDMLKRRPQAGEPAIKQAQTFFLLDAQTRQPLCRVNASSARPLGAGTLNLHIRLGQMTMALLAQALIHQLRQRLGSPFNQWDWVHFAQDLFSGLEGDVRVHQDTILVTYYHAPHAEKWKEHFENLPQRLQKEGLDPRVPWLYNFKLDFRFK